jgi:hypothetical protein
MHKDWTITWVQRSEYAIRNHTGYLATEVEMSAHGPMVTGMFGQPDWRHIYDGIPPAQAVLQVFGRAWGASTPYIHIEWTGPDGTRREYDAEIPFQT